MAAEGLLSDVIFEERMKPLLEEREQLENGTHPDYVEGLKKIEKEYAEELEKIANREMLEKERINVVYQNEKKAIEKEYENKLNELVEILSNECEEKKRQVEVEINSLDINAATNLNYNFVIANKKTLRRRVNEPPQVGEKRARKRSPQNIVHLLPEAAIAQDVKLICNALNTTASSSLEDEDKQHKISIENNKLSIDGKTFHKMQNVTVETANYGRFPAIIQAVSETQRVVHFKSTMSGDTRIVMATKDDLECGRVIVRKRY